MEQEIRFCSTKDGASIAYATVGSGPPLIYVNGWPGNLSQEWDTPFVHEFLELFASGFTLVRYDIRGTGLSDGPTDDMSLGPLVTDLEAVIDHLGYERCALMSLGLLAGPIALEYAAAHSDRVSHLVLLGPFLRGDRLLTEQQYQAVSSYLSAFGQIVTPDDFRNPDRYGLDKKKTDEAAAIHEASAPPALLVKLLETMWRADLAEACERIETPSLVLHGSGDGRINPQTAREVAARLRNSRFLPYEGVGAAPWADADIIVPEIFDFLGAERPQLAKAPKPRPAGSMATILFTDIADSTALTQRLGDAKAQELVRLHDGVVRRALAQHNGAEIKHTGDGIMASFPTASGAIECAIAIQRAIAAQDEANLDVHVGLNAGEPVAEEEDLFGTAVQLARRICDHADGAQIMVSNVVRELAAGKGFLFADTGEVTLKGFEEPVRLYQVRWQDDAF